MPTKFQVDIAFNVTAPKLSTAGTELLHISVKRFLLSHLWNEVNIITSELILLEVDARFYLLTFPNTMKHQEQSFRERTIIILG